MSRSLPPLNRDILEEIVRLSSLLTPLGPPQGYRALILTCRTFYSMLASNPGSALHSHLFEYHFDLAAPRRRLSSTLDPSAPSAAAKADEMRRRFSAMKVFKQGDVYAGGDEEKLLEALGVAWIMLLEDDGMNSAQLRAAKVVEFVEEWLDKRLCEGEGGWPVDNELNALALNIFWQLTDSAMIDTESEDRRRRIESLLLPIVSVGSRYPVQLSSSSSPSSRPRTITIPHFHQTNTVALPSLALPAILSYFVRCERRPLAVPNSRLDDPNGLRREHLDEYNTTVRTPCLEQPQWSVPHSPSHHQYTHPMPPSRPVDPTPSESKRSSEWSTFPPPISPSSLEEIGPVPAFPLDSLQLLDGRSKSEKQDEEWVRALALPDSSSGSSLSGAAGHSLGLTVGGRGSAYSLGSLTGDWQGTQLLPTFNHLDPSLTFDDPRSAWDPDALIASTRKPFFVELKEHWRLVEYDEAEGQYDHDDNFMLPNPDDWSWRVIGNGVEVHTSDRSTSPPSPSSTLPISTLRSSTAFYHTFNPSVIQSTPMRDIDDKKAQAQARDKRRAGATPSPPKGTKPSEDKPQDLERRSEKRTKRLIPEVVLTGKTDGHHGAAWGAHDYFGKVRLSDGYVVLYRRPADSGPGTTSAVFTGYLLSSQNLTGRWLISASEVLNLEAGDVRWSGTFSLARRE